jgi:SET domain-containing protein
MDTLRIPLRVSTSRIHGQGLFAAIDIKQGTRIIQYTGERITKQEGARRLAQDNVYIFELNDHYDIDGNTPTNTARYINHSCDPNCTVETTARTIWIVAMRDIREGEELTYDYAYEAENYLHNPCNCGAKNCCGYILARQDWGLIKRSHRRRSPGEFWRPPNSRR